MRPSQKVLLAEASAPPQRRPRRGAAGSLAPQRSRPQGPLGPPLCLRGAAALGPPRLRGGQGLVLEGVRRRPRSDPAPFRLSEAGSPPRPALARPPTLAPAPSGRRQWAQLKALALPPPQAAGALAALSAASRARVAGALGRRLQLRGASTSRRLLAGVDSDKRRAALGRRARVPPLVLPLGGASGPQPGRGAPGAPRACGAPGSNSPPRLRENHIIFPIRSYPRWCIS